MYSFMFVDFILIWKRFIEQIWNSIFNLKFEAPLDLSLLNTKYQASENLKKVREAFKFRINLRTIIKLFLIEVITNKFYSNPKLILCALISKITIFNISYHSNQNITISI